jgi:hypothetical protein
VTVSFNSNQTLLQDPNFIVIAVAFAVILLLVLALALYAVHSKHRSANLHAASAKPTSHSSGGVGMFANPMFRREPADDFVNAGYHSDDMRGYNTHGDEDDVSRRFVNYRNV